MPSDGSARIIQEIEKAADAQIAARIAEAQSQARSMITEAEKRAAQERQQIMATVMQEAQRESQRILAEARVRKKRAKLLLREELIQTVFNRGLLMLASFAEQGSFCDIRYRDVLMRLAKEALLSVGQESMEVLCNERDRCLFDSTTIEHLCSEIRAALGKPVSLKLAAETISCSGGVIVRDCRDRLRIDNTFEARMARSRQSLRTEVMRILFAHGTEE